MKDLTPAAFTRKADPAQLARIKAEGAVSEVGYGVIDYWGRHDVAELLLMSPTRHTISHWNEARLLRQKLV